LLDAAITGGQLTVVDTHARRGDASPVHIHHHDDEVFLLLEGAMTVWVGEARYQPQPGGFAFLPRNIPHAVRYDMGLPGTGAVHPGRAPGDHLQGGRLGPDQAAA
jgi:uncharacterized RmlC-like cupin family protein